MITDRADPRSTPASAEAAHAAGVLHIDLDAIRANHAELRRLAGAHRKVIAVLKADAYGHGCVAVALCLEAAGVDDVAAGNIPDAAAMRAADFRAPIHLLNAFEPGMAADVLALDLVPTVIEARPAQALARQAGRAVRVHVKVECGFGRFGVPLETARDTIAGIAALDNVVLDGVYTHIPFSDLAGRDWAAQRLADFGALVADLGRRGIRPRVIQAVSSPGLFAGLHDPGNAVAAGTALFGLRPVGAEVPETTAGIRLRPAVARIATRLVHVGSRPPHARAAAFLRGGTGATAVVPVGIFHGYRPTSPDAFMIVEGAKAPVLRVCLENTILDVSGAKAEIGSEAIIAGTAGSLGIGLDDLARWQGTSPIAVVTSLSRSLARRYVG